MQSVLVQCEIDVVGKRLNDLAEAQRYDGEVIAAESEHRDTDEHAERCRSKSADDQREYHAQPGGIYTLLGKQREYTACICADAHESRVTQRKFTENTYRQIERYRQDNINTYRHKQSGVLAAQHAGKRQNAEYHE